MTPECGTRMPPRTQTPTLPTPPPIPLLQTETSFTVCTSSMMELLHRTPLTLTPNNNTRTLQDTKIQRKQARAPLSVRTAHSYRSHILVKVRSTSRRNVPSPLSSLSVLMFLLYGIVLIDSLILYLLSIISFPNLILLPFPIPPSNYILILVIICLPFFYHLSYSFLFSNYFFTSGWEERVLGNWESSSSASYQ